MQNFEQYFKYFERKMLLLFVLTSLYFDTTTSDMGRIGLPFNLLSIWLFMWLGKKMIYT